MTKTWLLVLMSALGVGGGLALDCGLKGTGAAAVISAACLLILCPFFLDGGEL